MVILIVRKSDLSILNRYEADGPMQHLYGGEWGNPQLTSHVICSPALDADCVSIEDQAGVLVAILDEAKVDVKTEALWEAVRAQRDAKLTACDWTQIPDAPLNAQDKSAWAAYRQELRDLPENNEDPRDIAWPQEPNVQI